MAIYGEKLQPNRVGFHYATGGAGYCISKTLAMSMKYHALGSNILHSASSLQLPDDRLVGYVITHMIGVPLINVKNMHSHSEHLWEISTPDLLDQVTLSYNIPAQFGVSNDTVSNAEDFIFFKSNVPGKVASHVTQTFNTIHLPRGRFSLKDDPTRLRSLYKVI